MIGKYMAGTLARVLLNGKGNLPEWPGFFQVNFAPPVPGIPKELVSTRLFYRTVPLKHTRLHLPFWRAKGLISLNGQTRIKLASWSNLPDFTDFAIELKKGDLTVKIRADYIEE